MVEDGDGYDCVFFEEYRMARDYLIRYAEEYETVCSVKKQMIVKNIDDLRVRKAIRWNPNLFPELEQERFEYEDYKGSATAGAEFDREGNIVSIWSHEMRMEEENIVDEFRAERFENHFIKLPFIGKKGAAVRDITKNGINT